jgi:hypothetical protein
MVIGPVRSQYISRRGRSINHPRRKKYMKDCQNSEISMNLDLAFKGILQLPNLGIIV